MSAEKHQQLWEKTTTDLMLEKRIKKKKAADHHNSAKQAEIRRQRASQYGIQSTPHFPQ